MDDKTKASIAKYIIGEQKELRIEGALVDSIILKAAVDASHDLYHALKESASDSEIEDLLKKKKVAVKRWENHSGQKWLL